MTDTQFNILKSLREETTDLQLYATVEARLRYIEALMDYPQLLCLVGILFFNRFQDRGDVLDLETAIMTKQRAVDLTPEGDTDLKATNLNNLGNSYLARFMRFGELIDIDKAIRTQQQAVELTPEGHTDKARNLNNLGCSYRVRFEHLGELVDIYKAINAHQQAVELTSEGHAKKAKYLQGLGNSFLVRFEHLGELVDIEKAIRAQRQAVELTPEGACHAFKAGRLNDLGSSYQSRFQRLGELVDIDNAICARQQAVELTPEGHVQKPMFLNNLGISFLFRFNRLGDPIDIDKAITVQQQAVELTPEGHTDKARHLSSLGSSYQVRFEHLGVLVDIVKAIRAQQQAVKLTPEGHAAKARHLINLGNSYKARFEHLGELVDIDNAVSVQQQAIELIPEGHTDKAMYLNNLGNSYHARFRRLGELVDINNAISTQRQAVELTPEGHADKAGRLNNLGNSYAVRFGRLGEPNDIDKAISTQQQAVEITPEGHADKAGHLNNLGNSYQARFAGLGELVDIDNAISIQQQAVELTPEGHAYRAMYFINLGTSHQVRFRVERLGELVDIDKAIYAQQQAVEPTPEGHVYKAAYLNNLGNSFLVRFERFGEPIDIDQAVSTLRKAANDIFGSPSYRFSAALRCAQSWSSTYSNITPLDAYRVVIELIPRVVWLGSGLHRRYEELSSIAVAVNEAAAAAITAGDLVLALEWLEEGRCIVWGQMLQLRTPLDDLRTVNSELADELDRVSQELENAGTRHEGLNLGEADKQVSLEVEAQRHRRLAQEYEGLIEKTRTLPGCEDFLRPKRLAYLRGAANSGPVVVVNIDSQRCDALILHHSSDAVGYVHLPALNYGHVAHWQDLMLQSLQSSGVRDRGSRFSTAGGTVMSRILGALWSSVVQPVLLELKFLDQKATDDIPHITWCAIGPLAFLPLHAAGIYDRPGGPKIYDYVISSYTPTLAALLETGQHRHHASIPSVLAVSQPATPGQKSLPGTITEIAAVEGRVGNLGFRRLNGEQATKDAVLKAMEEHSWIHLACHAEQHASEPTKSAFILHDGRLELLDIMKKSFKHMELAVLSACQTATGDKKLPEEAVHLAAGMLMAGYPSVIATMWSIQDSDAPIIMKELYSQLVKGAGDDGRLKVAYALHDAVKCLRDKVGESEFIRWVPFVHIGI